MIIKISRNNSNGISPKFKICNSNFFSFNRNIYILFFSDSNELQNLYFPFFKNLIVNLRLVFCSILFICNCWIFKCSKSYRWIRWFGNVHVILVAACFAFISYVTGNIVFSEYLQITYIEGVGEASIFCGAIIGSCLGFLWL